MVANGDQTDQWLTSLWSIYTIKILNIRTPKKFAVITLKFEQDSFTEQ